MIKIKKGLNLPIAGLPEQQVSDGPVIEHVALHGEEYIGMRPSMLVKEGDRVIKGQALFEDKKTPGVLFTAPASGEIVAIHRGERRVLQSIIIRVEGDEQRTFPRHERASSLRYPGKRWNSNCWNPGCGQHSVRGPSVKRQHRAACPQRFSLRRWIRIRSARILNLLF